MKRKRARSAAAAVKLLAASPDNERYHLRLYVTGMTRRSTEAIAAVRAICEEHLKERYDLEVIDIYLHPTRAIDEQIIAAPTLVKKLPAHRRVLIGNLSDTDRVRVCLDLRRKT